MYTNHFHLNVWDQHNELIIRVVVTGLSNIEYMTT